MFLSSESLWVVLFWFVVFLGFFFITSVRFKGESWDRSVELKRILDITVTKFCNSYNETNSFCTKHSFSQI